jgi:hypothetical protein
VAGFRRLIQEWLNDDVDWSQSDSWPSGWAGQDRAMSFFQEMDGKMLDALGVVIVERNYACAIPWHWRYPALP